MHYTTNADLASNSIAHIVRDVEGGWIISICKSTRDMSIHLYMKRAIFCFQANNALSKRTARFVSCKKVTTTWEVNIQSQTTNFTYQINTNNAIRTKPIPASRKYPETVCYSVSTVRIKKERVSTV